MLRERVIEGLTGQGLHVEEDRGGLLVRDGEGDHTVSIWVDETDRVVRAEEVLCYPIDDFSEPLCLALDWLNQNRVGVTYNYQEAQRALVASTVWTSPSRDPSQNQLHLLVGLLQDARDRDADALARVAEGEASWEEVAGEAAPPPRPNADANRSDAQTLKFATSVYSASELRGEEPPHSEGGYVEPPTRPFGRISDGSYGGEEPSDSDGRTATGSYRNMSESGRLEPAYRPPTGSVKRGDLDKRSEEPETNVKPLDSSNIDEFVPTRGPRRTSRQALQLAVQAVDNRQHDKVDLVVQRGIGFRAVKCLFIFMIVIGVSAILVERIVKPFVEKKYFDIEYWFPSGPVVTDQERTLAARKAMTPGRELLEAELEAPLAESEERIKRSMLALGERARPILETQMVRGTSVSVRKRAYQLWTEYGFQDVEGARLRLLKQIHTSTLKREALVGYLATALRTKPPSDEVIIEALPWVKDAVWEGFVERLGRPYDKTNDPDADAPKKRAKALETQLKRDDATALVLRSLIQTGHAPKGAIGSLIQKRGLEWARGEGRSFCIRLLTQQPDGVDSLLAEGQKQEVRLLAIELLAATKTPEATKALIAIVWDRRNSVWVRQKAVLGLRGIASPSATVWLVWILNRKEDPNLQRDVKRALQAIPADQAVARLLKYLDAKRKEKERRSAVRGLGALESPRAIDALLDHLKQEPVVAVRLLVLKELAGMQKQKSLLKSLQQKSLVPLRSVSLNDSNDEVRREAKRLYRSLSGL